jgi:hypothetical protein
MFLYVLNAVRISLAHAACEETLNRFSNKTFNMSFRQFRFSWSSFVFVFNTVNLMILYCSSAGSNVCNKHTNDNYNRNRAFRVYKSIS